MERLNYCCSPNMNQNNIPHGNLSEKFLNQEPDSWPKSKSGSVWINCPRKPVYTLLDRPVATTGAKQLSLWGFLLRLSLAWGSQSLQVPAPACEKAMALPTGTSEDWSSGFSRSCLYNRVSLLFLIPAQKQAMKQLMPMAIMLLWLEQCCPHPGEDGRNWKGFRK